MRERLIALRNELKGDGEQNYYMPHITRQYVVERIDAILAVPDPDLAAPDPDIAALAEILTNRIFDIIRENNLSSSLRLRREIRAILEDPH